MQPILKIHLLMISTAFYTFDICHTNTLEFYTYVRPFYYMSKLRSCNHATNLFHMSVFVASVTMFMTVGTLARPALLEASCGRHAGLITKANMVTLPPPPLLLPLASLLFNPQRSTYRPNAPASHMWTTWRAAPNSSHVPPAFTRQRSPLCTLCFHRIVRKRRAHTHSVVPVVGTNVLAVGVPSLPSSFPLTFLFW